MVAVNMFVYSKGATVHRLGTERKAYTGSRQVYSVGHGNATTASRPAVIYSLGCGLDKLVGRVQTNIPSVFDFNLLYPSFAYIYPSLICFTFHFEYNATVRHHAPIVLLISSLVSYVWRAEITLYVWVGDWGYTHPAIPPPLPGPTLNLTFLVNDC